ncbi:hypothetical protein V6N13_042426 [Hibiscus sabdariffa]|uniref:Uncharacterized protein n=1 Tax=Hibiscus sabdariffa TaxID=183260 RepID=A0ABR2DEY0_9ROSI
MELGNQPSFYPVLTFTHQLITMDMNMNKDQSIYEYQEIEDENDVFFAEITRQILALTADEDCEETGGIDSVSSGINKQGSRRAVGNFSSSLQHGMYFSWPDSQNTDSVPTWLANLWRTGNGTGVFIPLITKSTRRRRPGRKNGRKVYRPVETNQQ